MRHPTLTALPLTARPFAALQRAESFRFAAETKLMTALYRTNRLKQAAGLAVSRLLENALRSLGRPGLSAGPFGRAAWSVAGPRSLEPLEGRRLMSADTVTLVNGVFTVTGSATVGSALSVQPTNTSDAYYTGNDGNGDLLTVPASAIKSVVIIGGSGADTIYVDQSVTVPVTITGNGGNDVIRGGGGLNTITLGTGNAWVSTRGTASYVDAAGGNVTILGGNGNDTLIAGNGNDYIDGSGGNDSIVAGNGNDTLIGEAGNDTLAAGNGNDVLNGGLGNDSIITGTGDDAVYPSYGTNTVVEGSTDTDIDDTLGADTLLTASGSPVAGSVTTGSNSTGSTTPSTTGSTVWITSPAGAPVSGGPQAIIDTLNPDAMVGGAVVVRGLDSVLGAGTDANANFVWNFGDASGDHDVLSGYNASHVYETAGTYDITLTVTNINGKSSTATAVVTIAADTRTKIYVNASTGNDANNGLTPATAVRTAARGAALLGNNDELLFARGQTYNVAAYLVVNYTNVLIGAYGTGADPVLNETNESGGVPGSNIIDALSGIGVTIEDLAFTTNDGVGISASSPSTTMAIYAGGYDLAVLGCTFEYVNYGVDASGEPTGLTVFDSTSPNQDGLNGYFVWGQGTDLAIVGNTAVNSLNEHVVRTYAMEQLVADNTFTNSDGKGCIEIQTGSYAWVTGNTVTGGDIRFGPHGGTTEAPTTVDDYGVIQDNVVNDSFISIDAGSHYVFIRNNVIDNSTGIYCIGLNPVDVEGRTTSNVTIANNTGIETLSYGTFLTVNGPVNGLTLVNNLYVSPTMGVGSMGTAPIFVDATSLAGWTLVSNNVWQTPATTTMWADGGINFIGTSYVQSGELTPAEWNALTPGGSDLFADTILNYSTYAPSTTSAAATAGEVYAGVYGDFYGNSRPTSGTWSAGAVQV